MEGSAALMESGPIRISSRDHPFLRLQTWEAQVTLVRLVVNWLLVITLPVWGGTVLAVVAVKDAITKDFLIRQALFTGKRWFWE